VLQAPNARRGYFRVSRICVATSDARTYYEIVSRMRKAGLVFASLIPGDGSEDCSLVVSGAEELGQFGSKGVALEDLDASPGVFKGQLLSRLDGGSEVVLVGVDPGTRIGLAVFYGDEDLEYSTFSTATGLGRRVGAFARGVRARNFVVRVGNGSPAVSARLVETLRLEAPGANIEMVDETGTSVRRVRLRGIQADQGAAARIAFRKGAALSR